MRMSQTSFGALTTKHRQQHTLEHAQAAAPATLRPFSRRRQTRSPTPRMQLTASWLRRVVTRVRRAPVVGDQACQQVGRGGLKPGDVAIRPGDEHRALEAADDRPGDFLR